jgi:hypothetical protein
MSYSKGAMHAAMALAAIGNGPYCYGPSRATSQRPARKHKACPKKKAERKRKKSSRRKNR